MKKVFSAALIAGSLLASGSILARDVTIEVSNLTNGTYFTPLLIAVHGSDDFLFRTGHSASASLQAMAEGGDISGLVKDVEFAGGDYIANPAEGLLAPGASTSATLDISGKNNATTNLSIVAMILPTNDGFIGLDSLAIPRKAGTYTYLLNGYDAGTEANDELITGGGAPGAAGIPADPGANGGTGGTGAAGPDFNNLVHIHRGVLGDMDPEGGFSDLDATVHHWLNPVARVVITVAGK